MIGAILGDIIGSVYEYEGVKTKEFNLFTKESEITDDSLLTMAVFCALEKCNGNYENLGIKTAKEFISFYKKYPNPKGGYGGRFLKWLEDSIDSNSIMPAYNSFGNGAAMRVSPVAYFAKDIEECKELSRKVTEITHNHEEGLKGAEATAIAIFLALHGKSINEISDYIDKNYYPLNESCDVIRKYYHFDDTCECTVPQSIKAFLESNSFEDAIRFTISLGGDADTMGAITGGIAEAYYGIPKELEEKMMKYLDPYCFMIVKKMIVKRNDLNKKR